MRSSGFQTRRIYDGRVINLRVDTLDMGEGRSVKREVVEHRGAVVIAALDAQGRVLLVRQYRHAAGETLLELPAGSLEPGEEPLATAIRELQEETGYFPGAITPAGGFFSAPGFCTEFLYMFVARDLRPQALGADEDEEIEVAPTEIASIPGLVLSGAIRDAKTLAGLYVLQLHQQGIARPPSWAIPTTNPGRTLFTWRIRNLVRLVFSASAVGGGACRSTGEAS